MKPLLTITTTAAAANVVVGVGGNSRQQQQHGGGPQESKLAQPSGRGRDPISTNRKNAIASAHVEWVKYGAAKELSKW